MRNTIRFRITALAVAVAAIVLVGVSAGLVLVMRAQLTSNLDDGLRSQVDTVAAALGGRTALEPPDDPDIVVQVTDTAGTVQANLNLPDLTPPIAPAVPGMGLQHRVVGHPGTYRVLTERVTRTGETLIVHVAANYDDVSEPVNLVVRLLALMLPAVVAALGALTWWLVGRTLQPVEHIRAELADITGSDLTRRVPRPGTGDEIDRLAASLNDTLQRLEHAVRRQQRFVADASHELRGPLTRIRGELELEATGPPGPGVPSATHQRVLADTVELQHLVEDLLQLARIDADATVRHVELVDLDSIIASETLRVAADAHVTLDTHAVAAVQVLGDPSQLTRAVRNLLDNAARHAATTITVTLAETAATARMTISNDGPPIPVSQLDTIFERFTRLDDARARTTGGAGLGLAITQGIIQGHRGTIRATNSPTTGTTFVVELPGIS